MEPHVCSVCGTPCGQDSRMGSTDVYLMCACANNPIWINDGRGGYHVNRNGAEPVRVSVFAQRRGTR